MTATGSERARYIVVLDEGTTSTRAIAFERDDLESIAAVRQEPLETSYPKGGWVEQDAEEIWNKSLAAARGVIEEVGGAGAVAALTAARNRWLDRSAPIPARNSHPPQSRLKLSEVGLQHPLPCIAQVRQIAVHPPPCIAQVRQLAEVAVNNTPRAFAERIANATGQHIQPPPGCLRIVRFRVALQPAHQIRRSTRLQPGQAGMIVDLCHGSPGVSRHSVRAQLQRPPAVHQPAVCIVQRFNPTALHGWPCK